MFWSRRAAIFLSKSTLSFTRRFTLSQSNMALTLPRLPVLEAIASHDPRSTVAIHSASGRRFTYGDLLHDVASTRKTLIEGHTSSIDGHRIAFLVENSYDYVVTLLAIITANAVALPLSPAFPARELQYIMDQSSASMLISSSKFAAKAEELLSQELPSQPKHLRITKCLGGRTPEKVSLSESPGAAGGMMLYTSGTTNRPKGVLLPHSVLTAQARSLQEAWRYSTSDHLLHVLPLHHIHGTMNAILTPLFAGSKIEFMFPFNATAVWERLAAPFLPNSKVKEHITFFTAVPTVYSRLLATYQDLNPEIQAAAKAAISPRNLRLNISGSAALPSPIKAAWFELSHGNVLLERYGMTEVGMALSCGLSNHDRVDGSVGWPLPSVEVRLVDTETKEVIPPGDELDENGRERDGEIQLRGPTLFKEYWRNREATQAEHVDSDDGGAPWFKTGDVAVRRQVEGAGQSEQGWAKGPLYFIRGRKSADIIKSGGEKVSALEVERELLSLPQVEEVAVVAVPSGKWGQKVGAILVLKKGSDLGGRSGKRWGPLDMRRALKSRLANYKIPQVMKVVEHIPRNAMGKVNKKQLVRELFADEMSDEEMQR